MCFNRMLIYRVMKYDNAKSIKFDFEGQNINLESKNY